MIFKVEKIAKKFGSLNAKAVKPGRPVTTDDDSDAEDEEKAQKMKDEKIQRKSKEVLKRIDHILQKQSFKTK